jgi:hypothetical protein
VRFVPARWLGNIERQERTGDAGRRQSRCCRQALGGTLDNDEDGIVLWLVGWTELEGG